MFRQPLGPVELAGGMLLLAIGAVLGLISHPDAHIALSLVLGAAIAAACAILAGVHIGAQRRDRERRLNLAFLKSTLVGFNRALRFLAVMKETPQSIAPEDRDYAYKLHEALVTVPELARFLGEYQAIGQLRGRSLLRVIALRRALQQYGPSFARAADDVPRHQQADPSTMRHWEAAIEPWALEDLRQLTDRVLDALLS
jgi:hypothetical protein